MDVKAESIFKEMNKLVKRCSMFFVLKELMEIKFDEKS